MSESLDPGVSFAWRLLQYRWLIAIGIAIFILDQGSKIWIQGHLPINSYGEGAGAITVIPGFFYVVHVGNTGAAWSILTGRSLILAALAAATLVAIFVGRRALGLRATYIQVCFGLLCGGIAGNLMDRVLHGHVIDFLDFHFGSYIYPTFNLADSAICVGVALYLISSLKTPRLVA